MAKAKKRAPRRKKASAGSIGLSATEAGTIDGAAIAELTAAVENDGGSVLGSYRDPFGATPAYEHRKSLSGGAYTPVLRRIDTFLDESMAKALKERERRGNKVLALDDAVTRVVDE